MVSEKSGGKKTGVLPKESLFKKQTLLGFVLGLSQILLKSREDRRREVIGIMMTFLGREWGGGSSLCLI